VKNVLFQISESLSQNIVQQTFSKNKKKSPTGVGGINGGLENRKKNECQIATETRVTKSLSQETVQQKICTP